jgi:hypothetical protein
MGILDTIGVTGRSAMGGPYQLGDFLGPDGRFTEDLAAIDDYVRTQSRPNSANFPKSLPFIEDYEKWRQGLGWSDLNVFPNDTMNSAKAKRNAINAAQNEVTPSDYVVEPGSFITSPPDVTKQTPAWVKWSIGLGAGAVGAIALLIGLSQFTPSAIVKRAVLKRKLEE